MMFVIYRDSTGEIVHHHPVSPKITGEELAAGVREYNEKNDQGRTAYMIGVVDGSFEAYLLKKLDTKYRLAKETIDEALDAIEEARLCISGLEIEK